MVMVNQCFCQTTESREMKYKWFFNRVTFATDAVNSNCVHDMYMQTFSLFLEYPIFYIKLIHFMWIDISSYRFVVEPQSQHQKKQFENDLFMNINSIDDIAFKFNHSEMFDKLFQTYSSTFCFAYSQQNENVFFYFKSDISMLLLNVEVIIAIQTNI